MQADPRSVPSARAPIPGRRMALVLAIAVHVVLLAILVFSIRWQSSPAEPVTAELYAPQVAAPVQKPAPVVEPAPPPPPPVQAPAPHKPVVAPEPPDTRAADIAVKAKAEEDKRRKADAERRAVADKQERDKKEADRKLVEEKQRADDKRLAETRERQQRETNAMLAQAANEATARTVAAQRNAAQDASAADWKARIQAKIRGNVVLPGDISGNPQAEFDVTQLPTGEIIDAKLRRSSGVASYDDAVQRAILKSSPLPRPDNPGVWQRELQLKFRPRE